MAQAQKIIKILSIDGGGMRGCIPASILNYIEYSVGKPITEIFDLIAGTSTGGLIAAILTSPRRYSAKDVLQLYYDEGPNIFQRTWWHRLGAWGNILHSKYPASGIEKVLKQYFGDDRLSQATKPILIPTFDITRHDPIYFKSEKAKVDKDDDFLLRDVCRCTSAAPLYFPPAQARSVSGNVLLNCVDGGVFDNNPTVSAVVEARKMHPQAQFFVVSLGTGFSDKSINFNKAKGFGAGKWLPEIVDIILDGVTEKTDYYMKEIMPFDMYYRIQIHLDHRICGLDVANKERLELEQNLAYKYIENEQARMDYLIAQLKVL